MNFSIISSRIYTALSYVSYPLQSLQSGSVSFAFLIYCSYKLISALWVPASYGWLYLTFLSLFSFSIILKGFLLPYSSIFLLSAFACLLSIPLICLILKWYLNNISAYLTYLWFSFFIIRNFIKFLQSILIINNSIIPYKNACYFFSTIIIANNSLL